MKVSVKTLKGEQFQVEVELSDTIGVVKEKVAIAKPDLPADRQKLIHAGKVLKDESLLSETGINENEFIVCMVTKDAPKKPTPAAAAPAPTTPANTASTTTTAAVAPPQVPPVPIQTTPAPAVVRQAPAAAPLNPEVIRQLTEMGFPEAECQAALAAARGNADLAVDFLMNGIPDQARMAAAGAARSPQGGASAGVPAAAGGIEQLRHHPQFNQLKQLVQQNPAALPQVLEAIGQQNPDLLRAIHENQPAFLAMMNEPISDTPALGGGDFGGPTDMDYDEGGEEGAPNPIQLMAMLQALPPNMRAQAAASLGITPEQLQALTQMISSLPPDQLQQLMAESGGAGAGGGGRGPAPGQQVIRLTTEEMASVTRLTELGFDQNDAIAAFLACDKNEALAANLLLEGWTAGGGDH